MSSKNQIISNMSSKYSLLLLFLVFLFLNACDGRKLGHGLSHKNSGRRSLHHTKDVKKTMILEDTTGQLKGKLSVSKEVPVVKKHGHDGDKIQGMEHMEARPNEKKQATNSGNEIILSPDVDMQQSTKIKGLGKQVRSILGRPKPHVEKENVVSKQEGVGDHDVGDEDYEPPHRKSPIHNLSP